MEFLPFRVAGRDFVIDASRVRAMFPYQGDATVCPVPIVDLRKKLGLPDVVYGHRLCLVIVETKVGDQPTLAGFVADYISDLVTASPNDCRKGKLHAGGRPRRVLDPDLLLTEEPVSS